MMSKSKEPDVVVEVEPEICLNAEVQAEPPQPSTRKELVATLHPHTPDKEKSQ